MSSIRTSLLVFSSTAILLITWLTLSFWHDAWVQRSDAIGLLQADRAETLLYGGLRGLAMERTEVLIALSGERVPARLAALRAHQIATNTLLGAARAHLVQSLADDTTVARFASTAGEVATRIRRLEVALERLAAQREVTSQWLSDSAAPPPAILLARWAEVTATTIEQVRALQRATRFTPRQNSPVIADLRDVRHAIWRTAHEISLERAREARRSSAVATADGNLVRSDQQDRINDAWSELLDFARVDRIPEALREAIEHSAITRRDDGVAAFESLGVLDRTVDELIRALAEDIAAHGMRRLIIDSLLVLVCVLLGAVLFWTSRRVLTAARNDFARAEAISDLSRTLHDAPDVTTSFDMLCRSLIELFDAEAVLVRAQQGACDGKTGVGWQRTDDGARRLDDTESQSLVSSLYPDGMDVQRITFRPRGASGNGSPGIARTNAAAEIPAPGSAVCIPLLHEAESAGFVVLTRDPKRQDFTPSDLHQLNSLCQQISTALQRRDLLEALRYQATHDALTGLPNRPGFDACLASTIQTHQSKETCFAIIVLGLDGLQRINKTLGHATGDRVLCTMASRLAANLAPGEHLARIDGDEFAVLVDGLGDPVRACETAARLMRAVSDTLDERGARLPIGASAGICNYPADGATADVLLKHADMAMYQATIEGRNLALSFDNALAERHRERTLLEVSLRTAIDDNGFELVYQPKVCARSGVVKSVEALLRWTHPELGVVSPVRFIPIAEASGLIGELGDWVLDEACRQTSEWHRQGLGTLSVAVNVSTQQFDSSGFVARVSQTLQRHGLCARYLELELTESVMMADIDDVRSRLKALREHGVSIAIDDFGTGYSSLQYLDSLPVDVLKIDRAFVTRLDSVEIGQSLVNTIVQMANSLGLHTVVEGVETAEQLEKVRSLGCDLIQGYYYSRPVAASELAETIYRIAGDTPPFRLAS